MLPALHPVQAARLEGSWLTNNPNRKTLDPRILNPKTLNEKLSTPASRLKPAALCNKGYVRDERDARHVLWKLGSCTESCHHDGRSGQSGIGRRCGAAHCEKVLRCSQAHQLSTDAIGEKKGAK